VRPLLTEHQIDRALLSAGVLGLLGLVWIGVAVHFNLGGILTAVTAVFFMATRGSLDDYRTERGLWMLAALIALFGTAMWVMFTLGGLLPSWRGTRPTPWWLALDAAGSTILYAQTTRLAVSMGLHNWRTFH
jgi:hypothetical protein